MHPRGGQRGPRRPAWGRGQPCALSQGPGRLYERRRRCRGSTPRRCRHRTVPMPQELEGAGKGRFRAGRRVPTPLCQLVESITDCFRRDSRRLKNQWHHGAYPQDRFQPKITCFERSKGRVGGRARARCLCRPRKGGENRLLRPKNQRRRRRLHVNFGVVK